jgi:hypothetical protein
MQSSFDAAYRATRRHYEVSRLVIAVQHAATVTVAVALVSGLVFGKRSLVWLPVTFFAVTFTEWRGVLLMRGARRGLVAGFASMLLPLSVLRPCCGVDARAMGTTCCTMPSACWAVGAFVGLAMALLLPKAPERRRAEAALGLILGVISVAVLRCSMLFLGEAVGLLGGMAAGVIATSMARAWLSRGRSVE